jgi:hypothetical protein
MVRHELSRISVMLSYVFVLVSFAVHLLRLLVFSSSVESITHLFDFSFRYHSLALKSTILSKIGNASAKTVFCFSSN